jgi:hypothetical protein
MKRTALPLFEGFIETPFEQRFQGLLRQAWKRRRWHVIVAEPGSGKTMGIRDLSSAASREAGMIGGRRYPVLAVTAPKNDPKEAALGNFLLRQWTESIYTWLTHPLLDPQKRGRVIMDHLMQLVTTVLEWSYAQGEKDVSPKHLKAAAELLTLRRDAIRVIDAPGQKEEEKDKKQEPQKNHRSQIRNEVEPSPLYFWGEGSTHKLFTLTFGRTLSLFTICLNRTVPPLSA